MKGKNETVIVKKRSKRVYYTKAYVSPNGDVYAIKHTKVAGAEKRAKNDDLKSM